jgi:hypothetical protein
MKVKALYRSVWLANLKYNDISNYNLDLEIDTNYFIKHKYYAPHNIKDTIFQAIKQNTEYKKSKTISNNRSVIISNSQKQNSTILTTKNNLQNNTGYRQTEECLVDLSASEIFNNNKRGGDNGMRDDSISFSNEINLLEYQNGGGALNLGKQRPEMSQTNNTNYQNNTNNKSDNSSIGGGKIIDKKDR